ncbi:hypothetical protein VSDG_03768 [Cytospora chrysosperma]|uniref:Vps72/YL1 C-terminal domain-containing protein n=1 Tax=Cytospora chrysosperma TaxID=252740 RepID=A0A423W6R3_CYTCH|nr:hypothetical protein VSDG_03768 [Valsa sordida]
MATDTDDPIASPVPDALSDSGSDANSSDSDDAPGEAPAQPVEWLATGRAKRSTAGNRMKSMLANEGPVADEEDDLELLFQEDGDDAGFTDNEQDDGSDVQMESSDDEAENEADPDDLEGEKELERKEREKKAAARKRKAQEAIPAKFRKKVRISQPETPSSSTVEPPKPRPKKKSERASWLPSQTDLPTRSSERKTTRLSKEQLHQQMIEREARRKKQVELMEKKAKRLEAMKKPPMTQEEKLKEAEIVERRNAKSLNRWEEAEKQREEERLAKLAALHNRRLEGPVVTFWSGIVDLSETQLKNVGKMVSMEEKPKRKRPSTAVSAAANTAAESPKVEQPATAVSTAATTTTGSPKTEAAPSETALPTSTTQPAPSMPPVPETAQDLEPPKTEPLLLQTASPVPEASAPTTELPGSIHTSPRKMPSPAPGPLSPAIPGSNVTVPTGDLPPRTGSHSPVVSGPSRFGSMPAPPPRPGSASSAIPGQSISAPLRGNPPPRPGLGSSFGQSLFAPISSPPASSIPAPSSSLLPAIQSPPVKTEPQSSSQIPLALRPDLGPRFMPPPNPHFAQPSQPSVLAAPVGMPSMLNGSMPVLSYAATPVPRTAGLAAPNASLSPSPLSPSLTAPVASVSNPPAISNTTPLPAFPSPDQQPTQQPTQPTQQQPSIMHTNASFAPIMATVPPAPAVPALIPAKPSKKRQKDDTAGPKKASGKAAASKKAPPPPPEPPEPEPPLEGKVTRSCILLQNFDNEAIKKPETQTQILFGRKMSKLAKPPHPPLCVITNHPARHRDSKTGLPFYNAYAFKEIQKLIAGNFRWSKLTGTWVGNPGVDAAKGVPERFTRPETDEERKERMERVERKRKEDDERKEQEKKLAEEGKADLAASGSMGEVPPSNTDPPAAPMKNTGHPSGVPALGPTPPPVGVPLMMPTPDDPKPTITSPTPLEPATPIGPMSGLVTTTTDMAPVPASGAEASQTTS